MSGAGYTHHSQLRELIDSCRSCKDPSLHRAPRHGTGCMTPGIRCQLMVVGQNPPQDPDRCLHGAWMLHFPNKKHLLGQHELLVHELVDSFGWPRVEIFATQGVKCPTINNKPIPRGVCQSTCAKRYLRQEINLLQPPRILAFGDVAHESVMMALDSNPSQATRASVRYVQPVGSSVDGVIRVWEYERWDRWENESSGAVSIRIIHAPHPSRVGRFLNREQWLGMIREEVLR